MTEMKQVQVQTPNVETAEKEDLKIIIKKLLLAGGYYILPFVPGFIRQILDLPERMMEHGYDFYIKKGDLELKFGGSVFPAVEAIPEAYHEQDE